MKTLFQQLAAYLGTLTIQQGAGAGESFVVLPWQRKFLAGAFAPGVAESAISVSRGNGKSHLLSGCACAYIDPDGPLHSRLANVTVVAASFEQARIIFEASLAFLMDKYGDRMADKREWRVWNTAQQSMIQHVPSGARLRAIGSDPRRAHGLTGTFLCDEPAQWPPGTGEAMRSALLTALGKQTDGRFVALGTRPADGEHWFAKMLTGECDYAQVHAADADAPPFALRTIRKANPSLALMPVLKAAILREAGRVKRDPALLQSYRALRLNQGTSDVLESILLSAETWQEIEADDVDTSGPYVLGIDCGQNEAMTAASAYFLSSGSLDGFGVFPLTPSLAERGLQDGVGGDYVSMAAEGDLLQAGQRVADIGYLLGEALRRWGRPVAIVADKERNQEVRQFLDEVRFPQASFIIRGMGFYNGGQDVLRFRRACLDGEVHPKRSLLLRSAMKGARVVGDAAGNWKLAKAGQGRRSRARDDVVAAAILAVAEGSRMPAVPKKRWRYAGMA